MKQDPDENEKSIGDVDTDALEANVARLLRQPGAGIPELDPARRAEMLTALLDEHANQQPQPIEKKNRLGFGWRGVPKLAAALLVIGLCLWAVTQRFTQNPLTAGIVTVPVVPQGTIEQLDSVSRHTLPDGTVLIVKPDTVYEVTGHRNVTLQSGALYCIVAKDAEPFRVTTPSGEATAVGTRFVVETSAEDSWETRVAVAQGKVLFADEQVRTGEECLYAPYEKPRRRPAPRLSYLVNWAREALEDPTEKLVTAGLEVIDPDGQQSQLSLRKYHVDVFIEDGIARTTVDQTFFNHLYRNTEGTFYFPLAPGASVSRLAMYVNGVRNEGGMVERGRGQQIYNEIKHQRRDPALLEKMEGNQYKLRIFPLEPRQEKRIFLSYTQPLEELYGTLRYWFPMQHTHSNAGRLSIRVRVKNGATQYQPESSTHALKRSQEGDDIVLEFEATDVNPDRDLLLHLLPANVPTQRTRISSYQQDEQRYFLTKLTPTLHGATTSKPRQWYVLNDVSASRTSSDIATQASVLERLLLEADDADEVAVFNINTRVRELTHQLVPVRSEKATVAIYEMRQARVLGAANLESAFSAVAEAIVRDGAKNPHILYLGDGVATDGELSADALASAIPKVATFVGIGIGKQVDTTFLTHAANATGGAHFQINPDEDVDWRVFDLIAALNTPRVTGLDWEFISNDGSILQVEDYANRRTLADGETLAITARTKDPLPNTIRLTGRVNGTPWQQELSLDASIDDASYIPRFWASQHIDALLATGDEAPRKEIVRLSKKFYVITPHTSLIVLEDDRMYNEFNVERGRSDHWASYPASKKIYVVREQGPDHTATNPGESDVYADPQTPEEIAHSVFFLTDDPSLPEEQLAFNLGSRNPPTGWEAERLLRLGTGYYNLGQYDKAREQFSRVLVIAPDNTTARRQIEKTDLAILKHLRSSRDQMMSTHLRQIDELWQIPAPPVPNISFAAKDPVIVELTDSFPIGVSGGFGEGLDGWADGSGGGSRRGSVETGAALSTSAQLQAQNSDLEKASAISAVSSFSETGSKQLVASTSSFDAWIAGEIKATPVSTRHTPSLVQPENPYFYSVNDTSLGFSDAAAADWFREKVASDSLDEEGAQAFREHLKRIYRSQTIPEEFYSPYSSVPKLLAVPKHLNHYVPPSYGKSFFLLLPGLHSTNQDVRDLIASSIKIDSATDPANETSNESHDPRAIELLEAARSRLSTEHIIPPGASDRYVIAPDGSFSYKDRTSFGLEQHITSDGAQLRHHYPQLGLTARRLLSDERREQLLDMAPHWVPSANSLSSEGSLTLLGETKEDFTILSENRTGSLEVVCGHDGRVRSRKLAREGKEVRRETFSFGADGTAKITTATPSLPETEVSYHVSAMSPTQAAAELAAGENDDEVVFEMPLRTAAYYINKIRLLDQGNTEESNVVAERIRLLRHYALVALYDRNLRSFFQSQNFSLHELFGTLLGQSKADQVLSVTHGRSKAKDGDKILEVAAPIRYLSDCKKLGSANHSQGSRPTPTDVRQFLERWREFSGSPLNFEVVRIATARAIYEEKTPMWLELAKRSTHLPSRIEALLQATACLVDDKPNREIADLILDVHREALTAGEVIPWSSRCIKVLQGLPQWETILQESFAKCKESNNIVGLTNLHAIAAQNPDTKAEGKWLPKLEEMLQQLLGETKRLQAEWLLGYLKWAADDPGAGALHFDNVIAGCRESKLPVSQTLLAVSARTHLRAGGHEQFVELENESLLLATAAGRTVSAHESKNRYGALWGSARMLFNKKKTTESYQLEDIWYRWFKADPENDSMIRNMANQVQETEGNEGAWEYLSTMIDRKPRDAQGYGALAEWYLRRDQLDQAQHFYSTAHSYDTANPQWNSARLRLLYNLGRRTEADALYKEMLQTDWAPGLERQIPKQIEIPLLLEGNQQMHKITGSRTTTPQRGNDWKQTDFDDSAWDEQWGTIRFTQKEQRPVWVRREFTAHAIPRALELRLRTRNARATVFINGIWAAEFGHLEHKDYKRAVSSKARTSIKPGKNSVVVALKMMNPGKHAGRGEFDLGLYEIVKPNSKWKKKR